MTTWDVRGADGAPVADLNGLARVLRVGPEQAAIRLLADAGLAEAAPAALLAEAKAASGGDTPPSISTGSFVSFSGGKGRVDLIVKSGTVPGVSGTVEATSDSPAARVVVWKDGKPTREKRGFSTHTLKRIAPLTQAEAKDPVAALVALHGAHERRCVEYNLPEFRRVSAEAVKSAYDRGLAAWPGDAATSLSAAEWALGRAEHFVKVAAGEVARKSAAGRDVDLLSPGHPLASRVTLPRDEVETLVAALHRDAAT